MDWADEIRSYCEFGRERVYLLLAIARSKESGETTGAGESVRRAILRGDSELEPTAGELARAVGRSDRRFRLYLTVNARDTRRALFALRRDMDDWLEMRLGGDEEVARKFGRIDEEFRSALQSDRCRADRRFLFDLDGASESAADDFRRELDRHATVLLTRETPNGYHVVTEKFDHTALEPDLEYDLKRDGLVFLSHVGK